MGRLPLGRYQPGRLRGYHARQRLPWELRGRRWQAVRAPASRAVLVPATERESPSWALCVNVISLILQYFSPNFCNVF